MKTSGTIIFEDGRPAVSFKVQVWDEDLGPDQLAGSAVTDSNGNYSVTHPQNMDPWWVGGGRRRGDFYIKVYRPSGELVYQSPTHRDYRFPTLVINVQLGLLALSGWMFEPLDTNHWMHSVWGTDSSTVLLGGGGALPFVAYNQNRIYRRAAGGWSAIPFGYDRDIVRCLRGSSSTLMGVVGYAGYDPWNWHALVARSVDGGATWTHDAGQRFKNYGLNGLWCDPSNLWVAVGTGGTVLRSIDAGVSWQTVSASLPAVDFNAIWGSGPGNIYVVGNTFNGRAAAFRSTDGGVTWTQLMQVPNVNLYDVSGVGNSYVVTVGERQTAFYSTDNGQSWTPVPTNGLTLTDPTSFTGVWAAAVGKLFAVGVFMNSISIGYGVIARYESGQWHDDSGINRRSGLPWASLVNPLRAVWGTADQKHVFAVGQGAYHLQRP